MIAVVTLYGAIAYAGVVQLAELVHNEVLIHAVEPNITY